MEAIKIKEIKLKLQNLGFTENESKVFITLLNGEQMGATEVAREAGIRRTDIYDILKSFVRRGFINEIETNTVLKFQMIDPRIISDKFEEGIKIEGNKKINESKDVFSQLLEYYKSDQPTKGKNINIELIRGYNKHRHVRFIELMQQSKSEILMMNRLEGYISKQADDVVSKFIKKGGVFKSIYEVSLNFKIEKDGAHKKVTMDDFLDLCEFYEKNGENIKLTKMLIANFTVFDKEIVFLNILDKTIPKHNKTDIIIRNKDFALFISNLFELCWNQSFTIKEFRHLLEQKND